MKTLFIVNPAAGRGRCRSRWRAFSDLLRQAPFSFDTHFTIRPYEAVTVAAEGVRAGFERLIAVGGDGTVHEIINGIAGYDVPVGVLPFGTGNDIARSMALPARYEELLQLLVDHDEVRLDVAMVDQRHFVMAAGLGFDGEVAGYVDGHPPVKFLGKAGYAAGALWLLRTFRPVAATVTVDGRTIEVPRLWMATVANCPFYAGGMKICPDARYDDGWLDVCVVADLGKWDFIRLFPSVFAGTHVHHHPYVTMLRGRHVEVACELPLTGHADGERLATQRMSVRLAEQPVRFVAGRGVGTARADGKRHAR